MRMQLVEDELRRNKEINYEYTQAMERCVKVRDEQIITQESEIESKDRIIAEITEKMNELQEWWRGLAPAMRRWLRRRRLWVGVRVHREVGSQK